jgi:hypothetical protein
VAPGKPDAATLVAYVAKTGMVPETLGRRLRGGLASDDPQQAVNAASLLVELGKQDDKLTEGFGAKRLRFAKAVMAGIDGGLSPERAVALATKRHGEPDPSDDDGIQIAEAEGGGASDVGKEKAEPTKESGARETKDDTTKTDTGAAEAPGETVGPEIVPVGGTEDGGRDADDEDGLLSRAGRDVAGGLEETPEQAKGGVFDTVRETLETLDSLFRWKWNNRALLGKVLGLLDDDAPDQPEGKTPFQSAADAIPEVPPATTTTGGVVRGIAQFLSGFFIGSRGAGAALKAFGVGERAAKLAKPLVGSVFADAIARDPAEQNLANLIEEHAELKIPVLEYLVARGDDSEVEARFKKALEGVLLGPLSDAAMQPLIDGLGLAVKAIKTRRRALRESGVSDEEVVRREQQMLLDARRKVEAEVDQLKKDPTAPIPDAAEVLATLTPETLGKVIVRRGPILREGIEIKVPKRGSEGIVKLVLRHPNVTDEELVALPRVLREMAPESSVTQGKTTITKWRVTINGVQVTYSIKSIAKAKDAGRHYLVTIFRETDPRKFGPTSARLDRGKSGAGDPRSRGGR